MVLEVEITTAAPPHGAGAAGDGERSIAVVTLNRPEARNALSAELVEALDEAMIELDRRTEVAAIVLTGADPAFCAGFDLKSLSTELRGVQRDRLSRPVKHLGMLPRLETPVIGAINGPAVTGGLELALACDFLIASERARFADTHARVGVMPGGGLTIRLPELVGVNRARQMSFTGDFVGAAQALEWGLVNEVVPHEELLPRSRAVAATIASIPPDNVREVRRMYAEMAVLHGDEAYRRESKWSRDFMSERFDQDRLAREREAIIERGRAQT
jgi:enoyl-CoA hydratase